MQCTFQGHDQQLLKPGWGGVWGGGGGEGVGGVSTALAARKCKLGVAEENAGQVECGAVGVVRAREGVGSSLYL